MANAYYNLAGWLRDVRACLNGTDDLGRTYRAQLEDLLDELGGDESTSDELESEDADADLDSAGPGDSGDAGPVSSGPGSRSQAPLGGPAWMADLLSRVMRLEAGQPASDAPAVARARPVVNSVPGNRTVTSSMNVPLPLNKPKATAPQRPKRRKGVKRGVSKKKAR